MISFIKNLFSGIKKRIKRLFHRPLEIFNISWLQEKILKHRHDNRIKRHVYQNKFQILFTNAEEFLLSIDELFVKEFYKFNATCKTPKIIDCGSYIGTSILYFKTNYPDAIITSFEPDENNFSLLEKNVNSWGFENVSIFRAAVWRENGSIKFNNAGGMSGSIQTAQSIMESKINEVPCIRIKDKLTEPIDFLKLDIEGAEYEVLKDCGANLKNVQNLFVEYHGHYSEIHKLNEILEIIVSNGFVYYIKEGLSIHEKPFIEDKSDTYFDHLLNIFAFRQP